MTPDFSRDVHCVLGLPFDAVDMTETERRVVDSVMRRSPCFLSTPNLNFAIGCLSDHDFRSSVIHSDLSIADGMPLVWLSRLLGVPIRERVAGSTLFERLRSRSGAPIRVFFFGGPDGVAEAACKRLTAGNSGLTCAGFLSPGFGSIDDMSTPDVICRINQSAADFVVVALGARKGQAWIERNRKDLSAPVISHLGAVVNFVAGTLRRAPVWMQRYGLEWLWRIREEPALLRRYVMDGKVFLSLLLTRVLPCAWRLYRIRANSVPTAPALEVLDAREELIVRLSGGWTARHLAPLRQCFTSIAASGKAVRVDLAGVSAVDMAFFGLLLLLYGAQPRGITRLSCGPMSTELRKMFVYSGCEFLLRRDI